MLTLLESLPRPTVKLTIRNGSEVKGHWRNTTNGELVWINGYSREAHNLRRKNHETAN